jgi:hypothetical protein
VNRSLTSPRDIEHSVPSRSGMLLHSGGDAGWQRQITTLSVDPSTGECTVATDHYALATMRGRARELPRAQRCLIDDVGVLRDLLVP